MPGAVRGVTDWRYGKFESWVLAIGLRTSLKAAYVLRNAELRSSQ